MRRADRGLGDPGLDPLARLILLSLLGGGRFWVPRRGPAAEALRALCALPGSLSLCLTHPRADALARAEDLRVVSGGAARARALSPAALVRLGREAAEPGLCELSVARSAARWRAAASEVRRLWPALRPRVGTLAAPRAGARPGLFLDRDGVLLEYEPTLSDPRKVRLAAGAARLVREANARGIPVIVATNQALLGRGRLSWRAVDAIHARLQEALARAGAWLDGIEVAEYWNGARAARGLMYPARRKPAPGMLVAAARRHRIALGSSALVGDRFHDLVAGRRAGLRRLVLVRNPAYPGEPELARRWRGWGPARWRVVDGTAGAARALRPWFDCSS